ncbi:hypothetical protein AAE478_007043 [Parahypoxylon ruwenzoriense]
MTCTLQPRDLLARLSLSSSGSSTATSPTGAPLGRGTRGRVMAMNELSQNKSFSGAGREEQRGPYTAWGTAGDTFMGSVGYGAAVSDQGRGSGGK